MSKHLMSSHLKKKKRPLLMRCLLMRSLLTFSTKKSHMSRYLKSSLLTSLYRFIHQNARRLLMSDLFVERVSRFLMSRHLMSSHLEKKMSKATHETPTHNHLDGTIMVAKVYCMD